MLATVSTGSRSHGEVRWIGLEHMPVNIGNNPQETARVMSAG